MVKIELAYHALFFVVALYACAVSVFTLIRERTKVYMITLTYRYELKCALGHTYYDSSGSSRTIPTYFGSVDQLLDHC